MRKARESLRITSSKFLMLKWKKLRSREKGHSCHTYSCSAAVRTRSQVSRAPDSALPFLQSARQAQAAAGHLLLTVVMSRGQSNAANDFSELQGRVLLNFTLFVSLVQEILTWSSIILANSPNPVPFC